MRIMTGISAKSVLPGRSEGCEPDLLFLLGGGSFRLQAFQEELHAVSYGCVG
jgi:hypothetical protein